MEQLDVLDPVQTYQLDSLTCLLYNLQFTLFRITPHTLAALSLILRLNALPFIFAYKSCAKRAAPPLCVLRSTLTSPTRTIRNLYRLYRIVSSQSQFVELGEMPERNPRLDDAVSVESVFLKRLGIQEYNEALHEARRHSSPELSTSLPMLPASLLTKNIHAHWNPLNAIFALCFHQ